MGRVYLMSIYVDRSGTSLYNMESNKELTALIIGSCTGGSGLNDSNKIIQLLFGQISLEIQTR